MKKTTQTAPAITAFFDESTFTVTYIVADPDTKHCALIDSVLDFDANMGRTRTDSADKVINHIKQQGLSLAWLLETHVHADHLSGAPYIQQQLGGKIAIGDPKCKIYLETCLMQRMVFLAMVANSIT
jgi:glyoxylase-like metal-dependent hydrolase (beta-lactamase superfamily II)